MRSGLIVLLLVSAPTSAQALDTWETWDPGGVGIDMGFTGGFALGGRDKAPSVETSAGTWVYGYLGLETISVYGWVEVYGYGDSAELGGGWGLYGTPIDTNHFDMDVGFLFSAYHGSIAPTPWIELNLDVKPDMELFGVFARAELYPSITPVGPTPEIAVDLALTAGTYLSVGTGQVLLGWRGAAGLYADGGFGHAAVLGWNPGLADWGELVTEVEVAVPTDAESPVEVSAFLQLSIWFGGE